MINKEVVPVFAQYHEDIILASLLSDVKKGFYVDIGANHETYHSVTKYFYDKGWSGINIEPNKHLLAEIEKKRKRDINIGVAISDKEGDMLLREYVGLDGLSTLSAESKAELEVQNIPFIEYQVPVRMLKNILQENKVTNIDFLKIDVEGYEAEVIAGNDWKKYQPTVVCVEANHRKADWTKILIAAGYERVIFDGLNEYYLLSAKSEYFVGFAERATLLAHNAMREHHLEQWNSDINDIKQLREFSEKQDKYIKRLTFEISQIAHLSLKNKSLYERLKIALYGLTVDWIRFTRNKDK